MATYAVTGADGSHYQIEGPDDADPSDIIKQVTDSHGPHSYDSIGNGQVAPTGSPAAVAARSPTSGMSDTQLALAGMGKAPIDLARGIGQMVGLESRQEVANSRAQDSPLMNTSAARWGNLAGNVMQMLPTARIPGANTLAGAGAIGAGMGLLQPSTSTGETLKNTGFGAAAGPAGLLVGRGLGVAYNAGKSLVQPFFAKGQQAIAARTLQAAAGDQAPALASALEQHTDALPGLQSTTAQVANHPGIAQLDRSLRNIGEYNTPLTQRDTANQSALLAALKGIAGDDASRAAAVEARGQASKPLYDLVDQAMVPSDPKLQSLLTRPSMQDAWKQAKQIAAERGDTLVIPGEQSPMAGAAGAAFNNTVPQYSGKAIQYLKMGLNDLVNTGPQRGIGGKQLGAMRDTLGDLQGWMADNIPALRAADQRYSAFSQPINSMDVGSALQDKLTPALSDFGATPRLNAETFARGMRNGDQLAANATGNKSATLEKVMTPDALKTLQRIGEQLARRANAQDLGRATGSNTAQNLISQNAIRQVFGPMGLPSNWIESMAQSSLGQSLLRPINFAGKIGEGNIQGLLADAALNPKAAAALLRKAQSAGGAKLWARQGLLNPVAPALVNASQQ